LNNSDVTPQLFFPETRQEVVDGFDAGPQSRVPFALRLAACEIPSKLARWKDSQDAYYRLLRLCRDRMESPSPEGKPHTTRILAEGLIAQSPSWG
jgi:hypothetical protein